VALWLFAKRAEADGWIDGLQRRRYARWRSSTRASYDRRIEDVQQ